MNISVVFFNKNQISHKLIDEINSMKKDLENPIYELLFNWEDEAFLAVMKALNIR